MAKKLHIDFETRSTVDLKKAGLDNYARHPTTDIWCMAYTFDDGPIELWTPEQPFPEQIAKYIANNGLVYGHNVGFEWAIWKHIMVPRYGAPVLNIKNTRCTMAMCYAMALPGALANAAPALGLTEGKDAAGYRLMKQMGKPRRIDPDGTVIWWDDDSRKQRLYAYCVQDVKVERAIDDRIQNLSSPEQQLWFVDHHINMRGVPIDIEAVKAAIKLVDFAKEKNNTKMNTLTKGWVSAVTNAKCLSDWLKMKGVPNEGVAKPAVVKLLSDKSIPDECREALILRQQSAKSSTAKLATMLEASNKEHRVLGAFQYHGAGTGRWAGRKVQFQNFPRPALSQNDVEYIINELMLNPAYSTMDRYSHLLLEHGSAASALSSCLRGFVAAPEGKSLICADYANVEGRKLAWLAGEQWKLDAFAAYDRKEGPDLYLVAAGRIYDKEPEHCKPHRQVGKTAELALGYQGGIGAFVQMANTYDVDMAPAYDTLWSAADAELRKSALSGVKMWRARNPGSELSRNASIAIEITKILWRGAHPGIVKLWGDLERAAIIAVKNPGGVVSVGGKGIKFRVAGSFLWCQLPSKRALCYPYPKIESVKTPWGAKKDALVYKSVKSPSYKWLTISTYGGKIAENITQASARDLLADAMYRAENAGLKTILHAHDELVCETGNPELDYEKLLTIMSVVPTWAAGMPIALEGWQGKRYRK